MSDKISYMMMTDTINLGIDGQRITLTRDDKIFMEVRKLINTHVGPEAELAVAVREVLGRKEKTVSEFILGSSLFLVGGKLQDAMGNELPRVLSDRLQQLKEEGASVDRLVRFWANLNENPSLNSREQLYKFLEQHGHPITEDGCFVAYRGLNSNFTDRYTGKFDNSPGQVVEMPRRDVDDDPNRTCSRGFHVAAYEYASGFASITVSVKVDPKDVVAVPNDYNGQKMRVCKFEVIEQIGEMNTSAAYGHSSTDTTMDFDSYDDEDEDPGIAEEDIDLIMEFVDQFSERYQDRLVLASRIGEEVFWLNTTEILGVLNDNL